MVLDPDGGSSVPVHIRDLEFETQVLSIQTWGSELESLTFENCHLSAGFHELTGEPSGDARVFRRCRIDGTIGYFVGGSITVDSCDVEGLLHAQHDDCQLTVTYSRFRGSGISSYVGNAHVSDNVFEQGALAIEANLHAVVLNNHVLSGSIYVGSQDGNANVSGNRLEHGSITADVNQNVLLEGNVVLNSESNGMYVLVTSSATITRNLVSGSTRNGFYILGSDPYQLDVTNNTSVFNHGCGFLSEGGFSGGPYYFTGNIGAGNGAYGQEWAGTEVTAIRYNNWFDNALGDVQGLPLSAQDLTVDPLFCDVANGDFQLSAASPLVNASGYGRVGALGIGCVAPGVLQDAYRLSRVGPNPSNGPVSIEFEMPLATSIDVDVFDIQGRLVASPARGSWPAGKHSVSWSASVRPGLYLVRYRFPGGEERRRLIRTP